MDSQLAILTSSDTVAVLYLITTLTLTIQALYYGYFAHGSSKRQSHKTINEKTVTIESTVPILLKISQSLQIPSADDNSSPESVYYIQIFIEKSYTHTPSLYYFHSQRSSHRETVEEPSLGGDVTGCSPPASQTKSMLCVVFTATIFLCTYNFKLERDSYLNLNSATPHNGIVMQVGRKLLQVTGSLTEGSQGTDSSGIGTYLGWGMAAIYMGGRLPQIFLNGLNPLKFIFALTGNSTSVASILVSSMQWSKIKPNLPWVVESSGCQQSGSFITLIHEAFRLSLLILDLFLDSNSVYLLPLSETQRS
ncbi:PQ-loop repeat family protein / transmembrane family protein [Artemisia annua]|uniref:PQ-loop repeat family protein / transmembrane family protein n=1 Tax=Artemisia annua TaxID=35608 RepID=A0A2U1KCP1_ARTAN|nr:PQ-loop repeat family protein / transmembrane family protein [Artemisia annua]